MKVGVLGAGQLGRMLALAGVPLGLELTFVDPTPDSPAAAVSRHLVTDYASPEAIAALGACDVVTFEFENVPVAAARAIEEKTLLFPPTRALSVAQDRLEEKRCFARLGIPTPAFRTVDSLAELEAAVSELGTPLVLKTRRLGYDGKGQVVIRAVSEVPRAWQQITGATGSDEVTTAALIAEAFVDFKRELSLISVRGRSGEVRHYPLVENRHEAGILRLTRAPAPHLDAALTAAAEGYLSRILEDFSYTGVLTLELFETSSGLLANEMAPRVHNSGHWTIEGARTSQFENHLRAICGMPLGETTALGPSAMLNLIGTMPQAERVLAVPDTHLHDYGKEARSGRKLGHITVRAPSEAIVAERLELLGKIVEAS